MPSLGCWIEPSVFEHLPVEAAGFIYEVRCTLPHHQQYFGGAVFVKYNLRICIGLTLKLQPGEDGIFIFIVFVSPVTRHYCLS